MHSLKNKKQKIKYCFNRAAHHYDHHCQLQTKVGEQLMRLMTRTSATRIIDIGCGTGRVTEKLAHQYPDADIHAIDLAERLLVQAKNRLSADSIDVTVADYDQLPYNDRTFDLVFSNLTLHWSVNLSHTFAEITRVIQPQGLLACSLALPGTLQELPQTSRHTLMSVSDIQSQLQHYHYHICHADQATEVLSFPNMITALRSIKNVGANYLAQRQSLGLHKRYTMISNPISSHNVSLTYVIGYFIAIQIGSDPCLSKYL